jgi:hypothetical protein
LKIFLLTLVLFFQTGFIIACDEQNTQSDIGTSFDLISSGLICRPLKNYIIRGKDPCARQGGDFYANRGSNSCHFAVDLETFSTTGESGEGNCVYAAGDGIVVLASEIWGDAGSTVIIHHGNNVYSLYAHLQMINVVKNAKVKAGDTIGTVGYTGNARHLKAMRLPAHLHFTIFKTILPLSKFRPISIVHEIENIDGKIPHMDKFGFINPTDWLSSISMEGNCSIVRPAGDSIPTGGSKIVFQDNFDGHNIWTVTQPSGSTAKSAYQGETSILSGYHSYYVAGSYYSNPKNNSLILDNFNYRGCSGKGLTFWNESDTRGDGWASDNHQIGISLPKGYDELYARFYIKFQPGWKWAANADSKQKIAGFTHYHGQSPFQYLSGGNQHPIAGLHIAKYNSGKANACFLPIFRYEKVYYPDQLNPPRSNSKAFYPKTSNYNGTGADFTGNPNWQCWEMRVKMNSAPGVEDGIYEFWIDGDLIFSVINLAWSDSGAQSCPRLNWNYFVLGGNSFNHFEPNINEAEQWYAIDDLVISTERIVTEPIVKDCGFPKKTTGLSVKQ